MWNQGQGKRATGSTRPLGKQREVWWSWPSTRGGQIFWTSSWGQEQGWLKVLGQKNSMHSKVGHGGWNVWPSTGTPGSGERPFKCTLCNFASSVVGALNEHIKRHRGEKLFECSECFYKGITLSELKKHMKVHSTEKFHKCFQCQFAISR